MKTIEFLTRFMLFTSIVLSIVSLWIMYVIPFNHLSDFLLSWVRATCVIVGYVNFELLVHFTRIMGDK